MLWNVKQFASLLILFLFSATAFSQVGPMGIGNKDGTPTPAGPQPKLVLWLDGSSAEPYVPQAAVDIWKDKSGNEHNFVPVGTTQRPSLRVDGDFSGPKGSFPGAPSTPCIRFIDNSAYLACPDFELSGTGYSIFFVMKSKQDNYGLFNFHTPAEDREILIYNDNGLRHQMGSVDRGSAISYSTDVNLQGTVPEIGVNGGNHGSAQGNLLNVSLPTVFKKAQIQSYGSGTKTFQLRSGHGTGGTVLDEIDVELVPGIQEVEFDFLMDTVNGQQFTIMATADGPDLFRTNSGVSHPYIFNTASGEEALRTISTTAGIGQNFYYWFYDPEFEVVSIDPFSPFSDWNYGGITLETTDPENLNREYTKDTEYGSGFADFNGISFNNEGAAIIGEIKNEGNTYPSADNFEGFIAEIIIYEGRLSLPATRLLRTYFWIKYGLNGDDNDWDRFKGNMADPAGIPWGGKYYAPIGIGRETGTNGGSINEARSEGLVLRVNNDWESTNSYLCAATVGDALTGIEPNNLSIDDLSSVPEVTERWTRLWEISGHPTFGNSQNYQIAFSFGEAINGDIPQNPENFVLLHRNDASSGDFSVVPESDILEQFVVDDELVFRISKQAILNHGPYFTIGTTDPTSSLTGQIRRTWYAYQSGNWSDPLTWTLDGSNGPAYVNPGGQTPNLFDNIVIGSGRNVVLDTSLPELSNLTVIGTLDLATADQPEFENISGSGLIRCAAGNFPIGNSSAFADPVTGGTLEFYGAGGFTQSSDLEVNKLIIDMDDVSSTVTLGANLITKGLFEVSRGTFEVNDGTNSTRSLTSHETVLVESQGRIRVNDTGGNRRHAWNFHRDLINNGGQLRFTNRTAADENYDSYTNLESKHIITAIFSSGSRNQELRANGLSYFSRIVVDKGSDMTYVFTVSASEPGNFKLLGPCNTAMTFIPFNPADATPGNNGNPNSFALVNGTAEIRENIFIPLHTGNGYYSINNSAQLWLNGGEVTRGPLGGTPIGSGIILYGKIKVSAGTLNAHGMSAILFRDNGLIQVDGGVVNANTYQSSTHFDAANIDHLGGLIQSGGVINLNGTFPGGIRNGTHTFSLSNTGNLFLMTGGTLNITGPSNTGLFFVNSDPQNINVTGGTVHLDVSNESNNYNISTRAPFWNLTLTRSESGTLRNFKVIDGTSGQNEAEATLPILDLVVRNNLSISGPNTPTLEMGTSETPADLFLSGNLTMSEGSGYIHHNNTTRLVGNKNSSLTFEGDVSFSFFNFEVNKETDVRFVEVQNSGPQRVMDIMGSLNLERGYFVNNSRDVAVRGNLVNRSRFGNGSSTGFLIMEGASGRQDIISEGGIVHSLVIDNPNGAALNNDGLTLTGYLDLRAGSFFIGDHKLRMQTRNPYPIRGYNDTDKLIVCSGNSSAGGLEILKRTSPQRMDYPIGVSTGAGVKNTPAVVYIKADGTETDPGSVMGDGGREALFEKDGSFYRMHSFTASDTLNILKGGEVEYLIVGGGGGGSAYGGGGAGGVVQGTTTVTEDAYPIAIGAGGAGGSGGVNGENSEAFGVIALGGGAGGSHPSSSPTQTGLDGGSGGGSGARNNLTNGSALQPGSAFGGLGHDGGNYNSTDNSGGGGGGAGGPGQDGGTNLAGFGGDGIDVSDTFTDGVGDGGWIAGGGGGGGFGIVSGSGASAGGGAGGSGGNGAENGLDGTGGGGGGAGQSTSSGGNGGSGLVVVRYEITEQEYLDYLGGEADGSYIRITPADTLLSTADLGGSDDFLNFYWRVSSTNFDTLPDVTLRFFYDEDDIRGDESVFEAGRVLSVLPFTRSWDDGPAEAHVNTEDNEIWYNGPDESQSAEGEGTPLVNADYTAGAPDRFPIGSAPEVFYSRSTTIGADWENPANWNKLSDCGGCTGIYDYHSTSSPASASDYPQAGDIAVIGFDVDNADYRPHVYKAPPGGIQAVQVIFTPLQDASGNRQPRYEGTAEADLGILRPTLEISSTADIINLSQISGEGALMLKGNVDLGVTGIADFLAEDSSIVVLNSGAANPTVMNFLPPTVPNLFLAEAEPTITSDIRVRGKLEVAGNSKLYLSETQGGNIEVNGDLILDSYQYTGSGNPSLLFNTQGGFKTVNVDGDVKLSGTKAHIGIDPAGNPPGPPVPWTPQELDGVLWLDATEGVSLDGTEVTSWTSQVGGYVATQTDSEKRPTYQIGMNGLHTVRFDGIDDFLSIPHDEPLNINQNEDFEIFSVADFFDPFQPVATSSVILGKGLNQNREFMLYVPNNRYRIYVDRGRMDIRGPGAQGTGPNLGWARRQGNTGNLFNSTGGFASESGVSNARMDGNTKDVSVGAGEEGTERFFDGDIAEIVFVKRALTIEERQKTEGYLAHKWGLTDDLPAGHPYKNSPIGLTGADTRAQLIVGGNIIQNLSDTSPAENGLDLYKVEDNTAIFANLALTGSGENEFINIAGPAPRLWKLSLDKGNDISSGFAFNTEVIIDGFANEAKKPVTILNGLLKFNDPATDITLSSGGDDFAVPATGGLELNQGALKINGTETGILLSGLLKITGGSLTVGEMDERNNYIEYSGSGTSSLFIEGGTLLVGSQIRRPLSTTEGALDYRQSGGDVTIGRFSAPSTARGMLEVANPGSRFDHTGGTLTFVRGVSLASTPSLLLTPESSTVGSSSEIVIGNADSPAGAEIENFGLQSSIPLHHLTINQDNTPVVNLISNNLELNGDLTIGTGASLECGDAELFLNGDVYNDGELNSATGIVNINHPSTGLITGTGSFDLYDLKRTGSSGSTTVEADLVVKNNFFNDSGEMDFGENTLTVKRTVTTDGSLRFDAGSQGLVMDGTQSQTLTRAVGGTTEIDILTINNEDGVTIPAGFNGFAVTKELRMQNGVFSLNGNLLEIAPGAVITPVNSFGERNMIVTGGSFTDSGVKMNVPANSTSDLFIPIGLDRFMPANLDFSNGSSGNTTSSYLIRINVPEHPIVQPEDLGNVMGMFFSVDGDNVGDGLNVDLKFNYHNQYVQLSSPNTEADYIAVRVFPDQVTVGKFGTGPVNHVNNIITYNIQGDFTGNAFAVDGDYFAGIDPAIPDNIPVYTTVMSGMATWGGAAPFPTVYDNQTPGGLEPSGAIVIIDSDHELFFNESGFNFYSTEISENATLRIPSGTTQHRLGRVTGSGTLEIAGTGVLPAGNYTEFLGCGGGKLRYVSNSGQNFEILSNMPPIEEVTLSGAGAMTIANSNVNICNDLIINLNPTVRAANSFELNVGRNIVAERPSIDFRRGNVTVEEDFIMLGGVSSQGNLLSGSVTAGNNGTLFIKGDLVIDRGNFGLGTLFRETRLEGDFLGNPVSASVSQGTDGAKLIFEGIFPQTIQGNYTGASRIPFIELNNSLGLTLNGNVDVSDTLRLTDGNIFTSAENMLKLTRDGTAVDPPGGRLNAFVDGPMQWTIGNTSQERKFPIGKNHRYRPLTVSDANTSQTWEVEYMDTIASTEPLIEGMLPDPMAIPAIETISIQEYWRVDTKGSVSANIGLSWGDESAVSTEPIDQNNLLVLGYNEEDEVWNSYGGENFTYDALTNTGLMRSEISVPWKSASTPPPSPAPDQVVASGGAESVIARDGTFYKVHAFTESGTLEVTQSGDVEVLVVGGGGSGAATPGQHKGGGGGAGGLVFEAGKTIPTGNHSITVGEGGEARGQTSNFSALPGLPGGNSVFIDLVALGGGGGGQQDQPAGSNSGGSGGGGHYGLSGGSATQPLSASGGFGNPGGSGGADHGRGGGGAGSAGRNSSQGTADGRVQSGAWAGGQGLFQVTVSGTTYNFLDVFGGYGHFIENQIWFAGGGGGGENNAGHTKYGAGGYGGGGRGAFLNGGFSGTQWGETSSAGESGIPNTGGGGGGSRQGISGAGGSGIVLVRYEITEEEYNAFSIPRFLTLGSTSAVNPLPVTWLSFTGENVGEDHVLRWATASEHNNDYFELERSLDAQSWDVIGQISAVGYSNTKQNYSYTDRNAPFGRVYYRLKQVDFDGTLDFAPNIVSLEKAFAKDSDKFDFLLYPNPTQIGSVRFRMATTVDVMANVSISDLSGKMLSQTYVQIDGQGTSAPVNCNFDPGIYLVTVIVDNKMRSKPLVITR